jgi:hypothetical protein
MDQTVPSGSTSFDKATIKNLIDSGSDRISKVKIHKKIGKQEVWDNFVRIFVDKITSDFVQCNTCSNLIKSTRNSGTTGVLKHTCANAVPIDQPKITKCVLKKANSKCKREIAFATAVCAAKDNRPFSFAERPGLKFLAKRLVNIGATYGKIDVESLLPHSPTVSQYVRTTAEQIQQRLIQLFSEIKYFGHTLEHWSSKNTSSKHLLHVIHYIDGHNIKTRVLKIKECENQQAKITKNEYHQELKKYNIFTKLNSVTTDNA